MPEVRMDLPDGIIKAIKLPEAEVTDRLKIELAIRLYEKGLLGFGKARQLAGMSKWEFQKVLGDERILRSYDVAEFEADLETLEKMKSE